MPEVVRGSRPSVDMARSHSGHKDQIPRRTVQFSPDSAPSPPIREVSEPPLDTVDSESRGHNRSTEEPKKLERRPTERLEDRPVADAYYDSRAATKREFKRRASTLAEYYKENPALLPQLPFTWRHGWRRWKLFALIFLIFVDACVVPIVLYYSMRFTGNVEGWIIFAVVATIWGGPTYLEFAIRSWRLIKKTNFYRPLGTTSRWAFDYLHWISSITIAVVTAFLIIGSAPHIVWLRILSLPGPSLLLCLGGGIFYVTMYSILDRPAPFRISSTAKGAKVHPGVFYIVEDVVAVNANAGRPYREAIHARYNASPRFRKMMMNQSLFWSIPALVIAVVLIVIICIHEVDKEVAYGLGWGIPFFWAGLWALISTIWVKRDMVKERHLWEEDVSLEEKGVQPSESSAEGELSKEDPVPGEPDASQEAITPGVAKTSEKEEAILRDLEEIKKSNTPGDTELPKENGTAISKDEDSSTKLNGILKGADPFKGENTANEVEPSKENTASKDPES